MGRKLIICLTVVMMCVTMFTSIAFMNEKEYIKNVRAYIIGIDSSLNLSIMFYKNEPHIKLKDLLKITKFQFNHNKSDNTLEFIREGKKVIIDVNSGKIHYENLSSDIAALKKYDDEIWIPMYPTLNYLNTSAEIIDDAIIFNVAEITLSKFLSDFNNLIVSTNKHSVQIDSDNVMYEKMLSLAALIDVIRHGRIIDSISWVYDDKLYQEALIRILGQDTSNLLEKVIDKVSIPESMIKICMETQWFESLTKFEQVKMVDKAVKTFGMVSHISDFIDIGLSVSAIKEIGNKNMEILKDGVLKSTISSPFDEMFRDKVNELVNIYESKGLGVTSAEVREIALKAADVYIDNAIDFLDMKITILKEGSKLAVYTVDKAYKLFGFDPNIRRKFLLRHNYYMIQKDVRDLFMSAKKVSKDVVNIDKDYIDNIYALPQLYLMVARSADIDLFDGDERITIHRDKLIEYLSYSKSDLMLDSPTTNEYKISSKDIWEMKEVNLEPKITWLDMDFDYITHFSEGLISVGLNEKYGYIDKKGKAIPLKYGFTWDFNGGLAAVRLNGKCGYIDKNGKEIIPLKYDYAGSFSEGLAAVELNGKSGYIDKTGKEIIPFKYDSAWMFGDGVAIVGSLYKTGPSVFEYRYKYGLIDKTGKEITSLKYDSMNYFNEGLASAKLNSNLIYINKLGEEVLTLKYDEGRNFNEGLAAVSIENHSNRKWGYIDKTGKEIIPLKYSDDEGYHDYPIIDFREGLAMVKSNNKWGFIDKTGKEIIPLKYDSADLFYGGLACVSIGEYPNNKYGYIDKTGKEVISLKYDLAWGFYEELALVKANEKYGYINKAGEEVVPIIYDKATSIVDGVAIIKLNGKWGIMKFLL